MVLLITCQKNWKKNWQQVFFPCTEYDSISKQLSWKNISFKDMIPLPWVLLSRWNAPVISLRVWVSLVCQCQATKCFQGRCIQPRYNKLLGRLGGPKIEIQCSHRNTDRPPCYVRIYVCHCLRLFAFFSGIWERGVVDCWHSIFLKLLLFSNTWYQLAFMPLSARNKWCGCSQQKRPSVKLEASSVF